MTPIHIIISSKYESIFEHNFSSISIQKLIYIITTLTDEKAQKNAFEGGKHNFPFYRISISRRGVMLSPPKGIISLQKEGVL